MAQDAPKSLHESDLPTEILHAIMFRSLDVLSRVNWRFRRILSLDLLRRTIVCNDTAEFQRIANPLRPGSGDDTGLTTEEARLVKLHTASLVR
ncbi:hypothetical protein PHLGIDRAFT_400617 [Phlebiopsis gigantea 11061_1 CR5-6]|uniref:F-box domain-containing protein n=1 Tax=Phlebiopsis gigantea (strain 11061_1 CR5-6) TaxID=745531 RepID=A0A0C3SDR3_PHLG1|nr:hypothetical protein PHLGIDRAFT_400617 [Phlebiopsis gigantea 11061_1 CR5-6]